jgi:hypothetical protein
MAAFAVTRQEALSWKWPLLQLSGLAALAYVLTLLVRETGSIRRVKKVIT